MIDDIVSYPEEEELEPEPEPEPPPPMDPRTAAVTAALAGDRYTVASWLEGGGDVNASAFGMTLLAAAASRGQQGIVELLLSTGATVDLPAADDAARRTALMHACIGRHPRIVRQLLQKGASLSTQSASGLTALGFLRAASRQEVLGSREFVLMMDCTRAITEKVHGDEEKRLASLVPEPSNNVSADDDKQLDKWFARVSEATTMLEEIANENHRRGIDHESKLIAVFADASGGNVMDRVAKAAKKLSKPVVATRTAARGAGHSSSAWSPRQKSPLMMRAKAASKLMSPRVQ